MFHAAMEDTVIGMREVLAGRGIGDGARLLDLGCGDGSLLLRYAPSGARICAVEQSSDLAASAAARGVRVVVGDLDRGLPFPSSTFDMVTSNQVLEHVVDTDRFVAECLRLLRPRGLAVVSTENLASWHNIAALLLGWQAFSLSNVSGVRPGLGNPLSNMRDEVPFESRWSHRRVFSYRGLRELFGAHGFHDVALRGAGYYPFPTGLARLDPRHAAFLTVTAVRP